MDYEGSAQIRLPGGRTVAVTVSLDAPWSGTGSYRGGERLTNSSRVQLTLPDGRVGAARMEIAARPLPDAPEYLLSFWPATDD